MLDSPSIEGRTDTRPDIKGSTPGMTGQSPVLRNTNKAELRDYRDVLRYPTEDTKAKVVGKAKTKGENELKKESGAKKSAKKSAKVAI